MTRPDLPNTGDISFYYGAANPARDYDGHGLVHVRDKRTFVDGEDGETWVRDVLPEIIAKGKIIDRNNVNGTPRIVLAWNGNTAVLSLIRYDDGGTRSGTWVLTA